MHVKSLRLCCNLQWDFLLQEGILRVISAQLSEDIHGIHVNPTRESSIHVSLRLSKTSFIDKCRGAGWRIITQAEKL